MEAPCYKCDDAKRNRDEQDQDDYKESSAASRGSRVAGAECVVMVMVDFDSSIAAGIGWRVCIDYNSFVTLLLLVRKADRRRRSLTAMLRGEWKACTGRVGAATNFSKRCPRHSKSRTHYWHRAALVTLPNTMKYSTSTLTATFFSSFE
ncbi:uncharacterized protein M421DRAFT_144700 [Didymella exigua CBS 183.55]|uniref:Uncharacterized protein n=1 Tax=Didymella exigua CBS 183.55 TaxID=1150837 RepID=A0A6A5RPP3_9PLEO|nr:uncharacterized protein M421DRAFT_144700 [Didymella exigua CBS 183.55]KAF1929014.1 hypothetical protein M421DRAFT_144700 [Didymella exigua CBS 183.55]